MHVEPSPAEKAAVTAAAYNPEAAVERMSVLFRLALFAVFLALTTGAYLSQAAIGPKGQSLVGIFAFFVFAMACSANLRFVNWWTIGGGILLQAGLAILVLRPGWEWFGWLVFALIAALVVVNRALVLARRSQEPVQLLRELAVDALVIGLSYLMLVHVGLFHSMEALGHAVKKFVAFSDRGGEFVFGNLAPPGDIALNPGVQFKFIFAFRALPPILFVSAFFTMLYHFGILQRIVKGLAKVMVYVLRTSGAETLSVAANVFMGQTEAPLIVKPYVPRMTNSELFALMVSGMAHISGGMMAVYINYGADPVAVITTCIMACPCSLYLAKLVLPETGEPETRGEVQMADGGRSPYSNAVDAVAAGTKDGLQLAMNVAAMLIVFIAFVAFADALLAQIKPTLVWLFSSPDWAWLHNWPDDLSLKWVFGRMFSPVAMLMGVESVDQEAVGALLGTKLAMNEHVAYLDAKLGGFLDAKTAEGVVTKAGSLLARSQLLLAFALTGFANFASIGIQLGGIGAMAPERRHDLARLGGMALLIGFLATLLNAAVAGLFIAG